MEEKKITICNTKPVNFIIAKTDDERRKSLRNPKILSYANSVLFVFDRDLPWSMATAGMLVPCDFVWLDESGYAIDTKENLEPGHVRITTEYLVRYVMKLPAGTITDLKIRQGTDVFDSYAAGLHEQKKHGLFGGILNG